jgi:hypothetical protein
MYARQLESLHKRKKPSIFDGFLKLRSGKEWTLKRGDEITMSYRDRAIDNCRCQDCKPGEDSVADKTRGVDMGNWGMRQKRQKRSKVGNDLTISGGCDSTGKRQKRQKVGNGSGLEITIKWPSREDILFNLVDSHHRKRVLGYPYIAPGLRTAK